jgi:hypothetical protein
MKMPEWVCGINDETIVGELRGQLEQSDTFDPFSPQFDFNPYDRELMLDRFGGLKIEIFANEHPPPHFRVICAGETANYRISDCEQLNGGLRKYQRVIRAWHSKHKPKLIQAWNNFRPSDCPVGKYTEP